MSESLTRPIVGIENRTAQEAFDIMVDRIRRDSQPPQLQMTGEDLTAERDSLRRDLKTAIDIGPRVGSMSLFLAMEYRSRGRTIQSIADQAGVTKGAMNQALKKGAARAALTTEGA
jgi:hypothetical protein